MTIQGLARYRLTRNPFDYGELDPVQRPDDGRLLFPAVDGFKRLPQVEQRMKEEIDAGEPSFFLVVGRTGAGRSSVANYLVARHRELRGIDAERFVYIAEKGRSQPAQVAPRGSRSRFRTPSTRQSPGIPPGTTDTLTATLSQIDEDTATVQLAGAIAQLKVKLKPLPAVGIGVVLDEVPDYAVLRDVMEMFGQSKAIVILTVQDYKEAATEVLHPYRTAIGEEEAVRSMIRLDDVAGQEVADLVYHRWRCALEQQFEATEPPFPEGAIEFALEPSREASGESCV